MRNTSISAGLLACALVSFCGCDSSAPAPRTYQIAIELTKMEKLDATCFKGAPPKNTVTGVYQMRQWMLWDGPNSRQFLQVGGFQEFDLGDADPVNLQSDTITREGESAPFSGTRIDASGSVTKTFKVDVKLEDHSGIVVGELTLSSTCTCKTAPCTGCSVDGCTVTLPLGGQRIDAPEVINFGENGT